MKRILFVMAFFSSMLLAVPISIGQSITSFSCNDQFGQKLAPIQTTKKIIVVFSKDKGEATKEYFDANPNYLVSQNALYLADISSAPSFVTSMFMIPKFKGYKFKIGLIEEEAQAAMFPKKEGMITIIELDNLKVTKIDFKQNLP